MSEVLSLEWEWVDLDQRKVTWPDSKTGGMTKPLSDEAYRLLSEAPRFEDSPFVCPSIFDPAIRMTDNTYSQGWRRILKRAGIPHVGTHGIRHRAATEIANSGAPLKVGMALTAHKTVTQFMRYVHTEDDPVRMAADAVAANRRNVIGGIAIAPTIDVAPMDDMEDFAADLDAAVPTTDQPASRPLGLEDGNYTSRTKLGNYRPFRHRTGDNRAVPPGTRRTETTEAAQ
jgi:hypothetical protein